MVKLLLKIIFLKLILISGLVAYPTKYSGENTENSGFGDLKDSNQNFLILDVEKSNFCDLY